MSRPRPTPRPICQVLITVGNLALSITWGDAPMNENRCRPEVVWERVK